MCLGGSLAHAITLLAIHLYSKQQKQKDTPRVKLRTHDPKTRLKAKKKFHGQTDFFSGLITLIPVMAPSVLDFYVVVLLGREMSNKATGYIGIDMFAEAKDAAL